MGQSTPTTTRAFDTFAQRYAPFRSELHPRKQALFDHLLEAARRHSNAINRRPHLDFERPVFLAMLMEAMQDLDDTRHHLEVTERQLAEACRALADAGMMRRRPRRLSPQEMGRLGQQRLT